MLQFSTDIQILSVINVKRLIGTLLELIELDGNIFDVNYCTTLQKQRHCNNRMECTNSEKCIFGFQLDSRKVRLISAATLKFLHKKKYAEIFR